MQMEEPSWPGLGRFSPAEKRKEFRDSPKRFRMNAHGFSLRTPGLLQEQYRLISVKGKRSLVDNVKLLFRTQTP
jgi:hypothetical protein